MSGSFLVTVAENLRLPVAAGAVHTKRAGGQTHGRVLTANIRNSHTRKAYARAAAEFAAWCEGRGITALVQVQPVHVAAWVEEVQLKSCRSSSGAAGRPSRR